MQQVNEKPVGSLVMLEASLPPLGDSAPQEREAAPVVVTQRQVRRIEAEIAVLTGLVALLGVGATAWQAYVAAAELSRERNKAALEIVTSWTDNTESRKKDIELDMPGIYSSPDHPPIGAEHTRALLSATPAQGLWKAREALVGLFNHFESVALAVHYEIADEAVVRRSLRGPMVKWYTRFAPFIDGYNAERGGCVWIPYEKLVSDWGVKTACETRFPDIWNDYLATLADDK